MTTSYEKLITSVAVVLLVILIVFPVFSILMYSSAETTFGTSYSGYVDIYKAENITPPHLELNRIETYDDYLRNVPNATGNYLFGSDNPEYSSNIPIGMAKLGNYSVYLFDRGDYIHAVETDGTSSREYNISPVTVAERITPVVDRKTGIPEENLTKGYSINRLYLLAPGKYDINATYLDFVTVQRDDMIRIFGQNAVTDHTAARFYGNYAGNIITVVDKSTTEHSPWLVLKESTKTNFGSGSMSGEYSLGEKYIIPSVPFSATFTTQSGVNYGPYGDTGESSHSDSFLSSSLGVIGFLVYLFAIYACSFRIYKYFFRDKNGGEINK
ncbi:hypothetical protein J2128_001359 [Methanomicrobium sp. W14]|uniref:hypothetical protein n=1 Tax=Methanomicrobium sp. W14 TaxID=2817839 RepID=UPI001AE7EDC8|nr:hypothetical protein [Methanomicrobium sp. W14]MBP2133405.1 hypothetical protein [Methanomicrobium sp. W14]